MKRRTTHSGSEVHKASNKRSCTEVVTAPAVLARLCKTELQQSEKLCNLIDEGCSVPFIARYRQATVNNLSLDSIRRFANEYDNLKEVQAKAQKVRQKVAKSGQLTHELELSLLNATTIEDIEFIAAPLKTSVDRTSLAARARAAGLQDLATAIIEGSMSGVPDQRQLQGVGHIISDQVAHSAEAVSLIAQLCDRTSQITVQTVAKKATLALEGASRFDHYVNFSSPVSHLKPHQVLAINRAEAKKFLTVKVNLPPDFEAMFVRKMMLTFNKCSATDLLRSSIADGYQRLVKPQIVRRVRSRLTKLAEDSAVDVFSENLRNLLLTPPCHGATIMGIDPGFVTGCKVAVISGTGELLQAFKLFMEPIISDQWRLRKNDVDKMVLACQQLGVELIALGNGKGCRQIEENVASLMERGELDSRVRYTVVTESGASVYSCSEQGLDDNPGLDPHIIGALSIARRLQDPLSEFVKIGPKHLGIGMYQHDVPERRLKRMVDAVVEECVSFAGLDLNYAPEHLLMHVSGVSRAVARNIVAWRQKNGLFTSREQLKDVKGIGSKVFEQCAGFVRIDDATKLHPLDSTLIHPESYSLTQKILQHHGFSLDQVGSGSLRAHFQRLTHSDQEALIATVLDPDQAPRVAQVIEALRVQDADIRSGRTAFRPLFRRDVASLHALRVGLLVVGVVSNVTHFGSFIDIGVGVMGLAPARKQGEFGGDAARLVLGQKVQAKVVGLDQKSKRITLSVVE